MTGGFHAIIIQGSSRLARGNEVCCLRLSSD